MAAAGRKACAPYLASRKNLTAAGTRHRALAGEAVRCCCQAR